MKGCDRVKTIVAVKRQDFLWFISFEKYLKNLVKMKRHRCSFSSWRIAKTQRIFSTHVTYLKKSIFLVRWQHSQISIISDVKENQEKQCSFWIWFMSIDSVFHLTRRSIRYIYLDYSWKLSNISVLKNSSIWRQFSFSFLILTTRTIFVLHKKQWISIQFVSIKASPPHFHHSCAQ